MLKGEKVILRALERDDLKRLHALERNVDLVVLGDGSWQPTSLASFEKWFDKHVEDKDKAEFVIEVDGKVIGGIGLHGQRRRDGTAQFGIGINDPEYIGKGCGRDAVNVLLRWAFQVQNYRRIWLDVWGTNERAIRAYRACGFVEEGRLRQHVYVNGVYQDQVVMGLLRAEWEARHA